MHTLEINGGIFLSAHSIIGDRESQQDYYVSRQYSDRTIAIVCDGMGGLAGGSAASRCAADMLLRDLERVEIQDNMFGFFKYELERLDDAIFGLRDESGRRLGAGTTIVAVLISGEKLHWFSVGDSKIYYKRNDEMYCITREHNYAMKLKEMLDSHEINEQEYRSHLSEGEKLISYLGMGVAELFDCNYSPFHMESGDCIFLCTDGVYRTLSQGEIQSILKQQGSTERICKFFENALFSKKIKNQDNATWIIIQRR